MSYRLTPKIAKAVQSLSDTKITHMTPKQQKEFTLSVCQFAGVSPRAMLDHIRALRTLRGKREVHAKLSLVLTKMTKLYRVAIA